MRHGLSMFTAAALVAAAFAGQPAEAKSGRNGALIGGAAAGLVGGVLLGQAINGANAAPPPPETVYVEPAPPPPPTRVYVQPAPPPPQPVAYDPLYSRAEQLHDGCDAGDRRACVEFGILIGQNRERQAQWRRQRPDMFAWDRY